VDVAAYAGFAPMTVSRGSVCLPNYPLCVAYETGKHDYQHACTDWDVCFWLNYFFRFQVGSLDPDEVIPLGFRDWVEG
jgi:hypothetical protein